MERITIKNLEYRVGYINQLTNQPETSYTRTNDKLQANIGNYHLYQSYGAVGLHRMCNEGGGVTEIIGLSTKRELFNLLGAFIAGLEAKKMIAYKYKTYSKLHHCIMWIVEVFNTKHEIEDIQEFEHEEQAAQFISAIYD